MTSRSDVETLSELLGETVKKAGVALKASEAPFALAGGYAVFARGGNPSLHDVDFFVRRQDVEVAVQALQKDGFRVEQPAEDWLVKASDDRLVDVIHTSNGRQVDTDMLERAQEMEVLSVVLPVLDATHLFVGKLLAFNAHSCDFVDDLAAVRSLREQIDWRRLLRETRRSPYARAFLLLATELGVGALSPVDVVAAGEEGRR